MGLLFDIVDRMHGLTASGLSGAFGFGPFRTSVWRGLGLDAFELRSGMSSSGLVLRVRCDERLVVGQIEIMKC